MSEVEETGISDNAIEQMLAYEGASLRQEKIEEGVTIADYRNSDKNEDNITKLLSSQGIPFYLERPKAGLPGRQIRMYLTVPEDRYPDAVAVLKAAAKAGAVEILETIDDMISR